MSNQPNRKPVSHQLFRRLVLSNRDLLTALDAEMREQHCPDGHCAVRNRARNVLREILPLGEP
jgi:hypothetical protein